MGDNVKSLTEDRQHPLLSLQLSIQTFHGKMLSVLSNVTLPWRVNADCSWLKTCMSFMWLEVVSRICSFTTPQFLKRLSGLSFPGFSSCPCLVFLKMRETFAFLKILRHFSMNSDKNQEWSSNDISQLPQCSCIYPTRIHGVTWFAEVLAVLILFHQGYNICNYLLTAQKFYHRKK